MSGHHTLALPAVCRAVAAGSLLALVACSDGYPTEDLPTSNPSQMSQAELLEALNRLGAQPHLAHRWRYALEPGCQLVIGVGAELATQRRVTATGASIDAPAADGATQVRLTPAGPPDADTVTVLVTDRWTDSALARSLLANLGRRCATPTQAEGERG